MKKEINWLQHCHCHSWKTCEVDRHPE